MNALPPSETELSLAIECAAGAAIHDLFTVHPGRYYYLSLITTGEAHSPVIAAWSEEALEQAVSEADDPDIALWDLKWSYADSPLYCFGEQYFSHVNELFDARPNIRDLAADDRDAEFALRLTAMEDALTRLDQKGLFGTGADRVKVVINVEVMPPDSTNTERALRLNPPAAVKTWLEEAAEPL